MEDEYFYSQLLKELDAKKKYSQEILRATKFTLSRYNEDEETETVRSKDHRERKKKKRSSSGMRKFPNIFFDRRRKERGLLNETIGCVSDDTGRQYSTETVEGL